MLTRETGLFFQSLPLVRLWDIRDSKATGSSGFLRLCILHISHHSRMFYLLLHSASMAFLGGEGVHCVHRCAPRDAVGRQPSSVEDMSSLTKGNPGPAGPRPCLRPPAVYW